MSSQGILHNDIKPSNILLDEKWNLKIINFSYSLVNAQDEIGFFKIQGSQGYLAPELKAALAMNEHSTSYNREKSDVYSLGLVLYQLLTYKNIENLTTKTMHNDIDQFIMFSNDTKTFLKKMIDPDPNTRLNFNQALCHFKTIPKTKSFTI